MIRYRFTESKEGNQGKNDNEFDDFINLFTRNFLWVAEPDRLITRIDRHARCFLVSDAKEMGI